MIYQGQRWALHRESEPETNQGITRRILAYNDTLMCVENTFEEGAVGAIHSHPHTQITYVAKVCSPLPSMAKPGLSAKGIPC